MDTGQNFPEVIELRDRRVAELGERLIVASVQRAIDEGRVTEETGPHASRNRLQTRTLLDALAEHRFDAAVGGARRDEERARAKERVFSVRDEIGLVGSEAPAARDLDPLQRPHPARRAHPRVPALELDRARRLALHRARSDLELPTIYFAHDRDVFERDGILYAVSPFAPLLPGETAFRACVRYRTVGDISCTGAVRSRARSSAAVVAEIAASRTTERGETRADDRVTEAAMEDRKREGYF